jgi:hypothetical protein
VRLATPVRGAPGVEQHEATLVFEKGNVRVAEDDNTDVREAAPQARPATFFRAGVVDHRYLCATQLELQRLREVWVWGIQVSPHRLYGRVSGELVEKRRIHQVPRVQGEICPFQMGDQTLRQSLGPARDVGVGNDEGEGAHSDWVALHNPCPTPSKLTELPLKLHPHKENTRLPGSPSRVEATGAPASRVSGRVVAHALPGMVFGMRQTEEIRVWWASLLAHRSVSWAHASWDNAGRGVPNRDRTGLHRLCIRSGRLAVIPHTYYKKEPRAKLHTEPATATDGAQGLRWHEKIRNNQRDLLDSPPKWYVTIYMDGVWMLKRW